MFYTFILSNHQTDMCTDNKHHRIPIRKRSVMNGVNFKDALFALCIYLDKMPTESGWLRPRNTAHPSCGGDPDLWQALPQTSQWEVRWKCISCADGLVLTVDPTNKKVYPKCV